MRYFIIISGSKVGHVINATVTGCQFKNGKYILKNGVKAGIKIYFWTSKLLFFKFRISNIFLIITDYENFVDEQVQDFKAVVEANLGGTELPYPLPNSDGCSNIKCPLQKGGPYLYQYTLALPKYFQLPKVQQYLV